MQSPSGPPMKNQKHSSQRQPSSSREQQQQHHFNPSDSSERSNNLEETYLTPASPPATVAFFGRPLIPPNTTLSRAVIMSNASASTTENKGSVLRNNRGQRSAARSSSNTASSPPQRPISNLTVLLNQQQEAQRTSRATDTAAAPNIGGNTPVERPMIAQNEADSASGPPPGPSPHLGTSAPSHLQSQKMKPLPIDDALNLCRQHSTGTVMSTGALSSRSSDKVRRCISSKELGTIAPPSGSPYAYMIYKKGQLENSMRQRLLILKESYPASCSHKIEHSDGTDGESSSTSSRRKEGSNEMRNRRRAQHNQAIVDDLCDVVADLFIAEAKLLKPNSYGVPDQSPSSLFRRDQVVKSIRNFISALPARYALGADTPSEVLLHMRLMAAARSDKTKAAVHIHNMDDEYNWSRTITAVNEKNMKMLRLVTISCNDADGLLEYITRLLASGGSRVLDADVMLSTDGIVLDRFVVEMSGRLRLDRLANLIEAFLRENANGGPEPADKTGSSPSSASSEPSGPLYYKNADVPETLSSRDIQEEIQTAVPLTEVLASTSAGDFLQAPSLPQLRKMHSMPTSSVSTPFPNVRLSMRNELKEGVTIMLTPDSAVGPEFVADQAEPPPQSPRQKRPLVNRRGSFNLDEFESADERKEPALDYVTISSSDINNVGAEVEDRVVPLIPFDELMLIETLGTGRVSTIYRAAWQRHVAPPTAAVDVQMVALKVAMINNMTGDTSHVDELRREADIAARLSHPNVVDLVGLAADQECFCLAYDFCEGGSLLSLLSDSRRYYEYLPIALDIANGMAYLHSRNVIHRDLKPSNILLTRDHRAKISDFGMSVANTGQELTAETGTYRYMAPEVIRHESYSSNADVYSFGICLWQLITREVPFASMTPIQAAYAVAEGRRPEIPASTPRRLQEIIMACWDQDSHRRPSFTYIAMALADYAKMAFSPANVGALTLQIANEMLANVEGNSTVNVDFSTPVAAAEPSFMEPGFPNDSSHSHGNIGLEIE